MNQIRILDLNCTQPRMGGLKRPPILFVAVMSLRGRQPEATFGLAVRLLRRSAPRNDILEEVKHDY